MAEVDVDTGKPPVVFESDMDRHAWREYASSTLRGLSSHPDALTDGHEEDRAWSAAKAADRLLAEERRRRNPRHRRRRRS